VVISLIKIGIQSLTMRQGLKPLNTIGYSQKITATRVATYTWDDTAVVYSNGQVAMIIDAIDFLDRVVDPEKFENHWKNLVAPWSLKDLVDDTLRYLPWDLRCLSQLTKNDKQRGSSPLNL